MQVLIDYDNLLEGERRGGVALIAELIAKALGPTRLKEGESIDLRFYGGWHERKALSRDGQRVVAEINAVFPSFVSLKAGGKKSKIRAELASSLVVEPGTSLWGTYRPDRPPRKIVCEDPATLRCGRTPCMMELVRKFFQTGACPDPACGASAKRLLRQPQQKLVDTMIVVDLIHAALQKTAATAVVTSDDDLWPGIWYACLSGMTVFHIHTRDSGWESDVPSGQSCYESLRL